MRDDDKLLLEAMEGQPRSIAKLALACGWPHKSKVQRVMERLKRDGLVAKRKGKWVPTRKQPAAVAVVESPPPRAAKAPGASWGVIRFDPATGRAVFDGWYCDEGWAVKVIERWRQWYPGAIVAPVRRGEVAHVATKRLCESRCFIMALAPG